MRRSGKPNTRGLNNKIKLSQDRIDNLTKKKFICTIAVFVFTWMFLICILFAFVFNPVDVLGEIGETIGIGFLIVGCFSFMAIFFLLNFRNRVNCNLDSEEVQHELLESRKKKMR